MNQITAARMGEITPEMTHVAQAESSTPEEIAARIAKGTVVITKNTIRQNVVPLGIGQGLKTKINANIGTSKDHLQIDEEMEKARVAVEAGADTIMDLSTGGNLPEIRKRILSETRVPLGTVPIYEAALRAVE